MTEKVSLRVSANEADDSAVVGCCLYFRKRKKIPISSRLEAKSTVGDEPGYREPVGVVGTLLDKATDTTDRVTPPEITIQATDSATPPEHSNNVGVTELTVSESGSLVELKLQSKRQIAERNLKDSAIKLDKLMPKDATERHIHEAIAFQCGRFESKDTGDITKGIGLAITNYMDQRSQLKESRSPVKVFVQKWFCLSYPYIQRGLITAGQILPPPYGLIVTGVLYLTAHDSSLKSEQIDETVAYLSKTIDSVQLEEDYSSALAGDQLDKIECAAINLSSAIMECLAVAITARKRSIWTLLVDKPDILGAKAKVKDAVDAYIAVAILLSSALMLQNKKKERKRDVLEWIWEGSFDSEEKHKLLVESYIPETGKWFLESSQLQDWIQMVEDTPSMLLCSGIAGAGKTYITSAVIDGLQKTAKPPEVGVAYFYFDYRNHRQRAEDVVRCVLKQLIHQLAELPRDIDDEYDKWDKGGRKNRPDGDVVVKLLISCSKKFSKGVFIILDALDECLERLEEERLLSHLKKFYDARVRLFVTTRPHLLQELELQEVFSNAHTIQISARDDDVESYLRSKLIKLRSGKLKEEIVEKIKAAADGMFLLAEFQLRYVLDQFEPIQMKEALDSLPTNFEEAYGRALQPMTEGQKRAAFRVMSWIFHARRPLLMRELREALVIHEEKKELDEDSIQGPSEIIGECASLVVYDKTTDTVAFAHYTVQEYLRDHCMDRLLPSSTLAKLCLAYLNSNVFQNSLPEDEEEFSKWLDEHQFSRYAVCWWASHIQEDNVEERTDIQAEFFNALAPKNKRTMFYRIESRIEFYPTLSEPFLHILVRKGLTALCRAFLDRVEAKTLEIQDLPEEEMNIEIENSYGSTALLIAAEQSQWETVKVLVEKNADVTRVNYYSRTVLHSAAASGRGDVVKVVLEKNKDILNQRDNYGETCLMQAIMGGNDEIAQQLLRAKPDLALVENYDSVTPLHHAASYGRDYVARLLLEANANIEARTTSDGSTPLHTAARGSRHEMIRLLLEHGADVATQTLDGATALHIASEQGSIESMKVLLAHNANIEAKNNMGATALHESVKSQWYQSAEATELLINSNANVGAVTELGETPLHWAIAGGNVLAAELLMAHGADGSACATNGDTPLHVSATRWNAEPIRFLLEKKVNVNARGENGDTPLHRAVPYAAVDLVQILLDNGAWINVRSYNDETPLHRAISARNRPVVELLLDNKAYVNVRSKQGQTPLLIATANQDIDLMRLLLDRKAYVNARANDGNTPLHLAANTWRVDLATLLVEHNADINAQGERGYTPLHLVAQSWNTELAELFLEKNANPDALTDNGETPLHIAVSSWNSPLVELLLNKNADIDTTDQNGCSALHLAASRGNLSTMQLLVDRGADVNIQDMEGQTALHYATSQGSLEMVQLLLEHKANVLLHMRGYTVLHSALDHETCNMEIIKMLVDRDPKILSVKSLDGETPHEVAVRNCHGEAVKFLNEFSKLHDEAISDETKTTDETQKETTRDE